MPEGLLLVVWSSTGLGVVGWVGLWVHSFYFAMGWVSRSLGWVGLKKLDPQTTLIIMTNVLPQTWRSFPAYRSPVAGALEQFCRAGSSWVRITLVHTDTPSVRAGQSAPSVQFAQQLTPSSRDSSTKVTDLQSGRGCLTIDSWKKIYFNDFGDRNN